MRYKPLWWATGIGAVAVLAVGLATMAQPQSPVHFEGLINDYTPADGVIPSGPSELRGVWSLDLHGNSQTADFSAALVMVRSDYWVVLNPAEVDNDTSTGRFPHTHHITLENATVTPITGGFSVSGQVTVTANGNPAPFASFCTALTPCTLEVDLTGGTAVNPSNIVLKFGGPPTGHFGTQAIHGVVRTAK